MRGRTEEGGVGGGAKKCPEGEGEMSQSLPEQVLAWTSTFLHARLMERTKENKTQLLDDGFT